MVVHLKHSTAILAFLHYIRIYHLLTKQFFHRFPLMGKVTYKFFNIIMKLKVALYANKSKVTFFHLTSIHEKLDP